MSARIAADLGFETAVLGGSMASLAILGAPDLTLITLSELADLVRRITRAGSVPLLVDADHGYGNALNVRRTVEELEAAGVAAMTIEDTALPPAFGASGTGFISIAEGAAKMRAARDARLDPSLVIVGRTSAAALNGLDDAIARCRAYAQAGVDALFINGGLETRADLERLAGATGLPVILSRLAPEIDDPAVLAANNVRIALQGHTTYPAAAEAVFGLMRAQRERAGAVDLPELSGKPLMDRITRKAAYAEWGRDYLGA
jgi:carboxyvinyl-carboxyphosphonate phosphorylmutase